MTGSRLAAAALLATFASWHLVPDRALDFGWSLAVHLVTTGLWLVLVAAILRGRWQPRFAEAFALVAILRLIALPMQPELSDDMYRYMWEGRLVLEGENPYLFAPDDPTLEHLRARDGADGAYWARINNPSIPAAYPPAVQYALAASALVPNLAGLGARIVFGGFDLLAFVLLWVWLPRVGHGSARALVYGLCPLIALEFAGEGHSDSLAVAAMVAGLLAASYGRAAATGGAFAVATAAKLIPVVLLPFALRDAARGRYGRALAIGVVAFAGTLVLLYLPFVPGEDPARILRGASEYAVRWRSNDSAFGLIHAAVEWLHATGWIRGEVQRAAKYPLAVIALAVLAVCWRRRLRAEDAAVTFFVFFLAFAPTVHPWYVGLLVPWLCVRLLVGPLLFTGTVFLAYHVLPGWQRGAGEWRESGAIIALEYLPFYAGLFGAWLRSRLTGAVPGSTEGSGCPPSG